jgi:hypothetical protein
MPRLRPKKPVALSEPQWCVCVEAFGPVIGQRISRGEFRTIDHPDVRQFPSFWSIVGPRLDEGGVKNGNE